MKFGTTIIATIALAALCSGLYLVGGTRAATAPPEQCDVPQSFVESDTDLPAVRKRPRSGITLISA